MNGHTGPRLTGADNAASLAVLALSNLLSANMDVGLKDCLALGYHQDPALRTAFTHISANILRQGNHFGGLGGSRTSSTPKVYLEVLTSPNLALALAVCESCPPNEVDEMSSLLFRTFEASSSLLKLLEVLIEREVSQTST